MAVGRLDRAYIPWAYSIVDPSIDMDCIGDYPPCAADCGRSFYNIIHATVFGNFRDSCISRESINLFQVSIFRRTFCGPTSTTPAPAATSTAAHSELAATASSSLDGLNSITAC